MEARTVWELAQVNIARPLEPLDSPLLAEFMAALTPINALADAAPGFVWRLQTDDVRPTVPEAENRLASLRSRGSTPYAFSFRSPFPAPSAPFEIVEQIRSDDETPAEWPADWRCPV